MTTLAVGTEKGGYILRQRNGSWETEGPLFPGWMVTAWGETPDGSKLAALGSNWFGASLHRSENLADWTQIEPGMSFPEESPRKLQQIWQIRAVGERLLCGVSEAGLFSSADGGNSWDHLDGFSRIHSFEDWLPGLGGLAAHHILSADDTIWVGVSAAGVFRSRDHGKSWTSVNHGIIEPSGEEPSEGAEEAAEVQDSAEETETEPPAYCVHGMTLDPDQPNNLWRQDHTGVYRSRDGGDSWEQIETGLPGNFGFSILRDHASGSLFVFPLVADVNRIPPDGKFRVYRSNNGGDSWEVSGAGFSDSPNFSIVLRGAATAPGNGEIFFGTTSGQVWASTDAGDNWTQLPVTTPRILSVHKFA